MKADTSMQHADKPRITCPVSRLLVSTALAILFVITTMACNAPSESRPKVVVLAIDAMGWKVLQPMIEDGRVPHFAELVAHGASGVLGTNPGCSPRYWTTIATGKAPAKHQLWGWTVFNREDGRRPMRSYDRKAKAIWNILGDREKTTGVVNYLVTWPPEEINGWIVPSYFYHGLASEDQVTSPASLAAEIAHLEIPEFITEKSRRHSNEEIVANAWDEARWVSSVGRHIQEHKDPDLLIAYTLGIDWLGHRFWAYYEPEHYQDPMWSLDPKLVEQYGGVIPDLYETTDRELGKIIDAIDENTTVIVLSDHAMKAWGTGGDTNVAVVNYDRVLELAGFLVTDQRGRPDLDRSLAFCTDQGSWEDEMSYITVTLPTDHPQYADTVSGLLELFRGMSWETDATPFFKDAFTRDGLGPDFPYSTDSFDVVVEETDAWPYRAPFSKRADENVLVDGRSVPLRELLSFTGPGKPGIHDLEDGVIIMAGKNVRRGISLEEATIRDITPTLLHLLGLPVGKDMDGKVLVNALDPAFLRANPVRFIDTYEDASTTTGTPIEDGALPEEEVLQERLRTLGYLE